MTRCRQPLAFLGLFSALFLLASCKPGIDEQLMSRAKNAAQNSSGAIFSALENRDEALALAILDSGIQQQKVDARGCTPLMVAASTNNTKVARRLLPRDATHLASDNAGLTALDYAARADEAWLVDELLKRGASPDSSLPNGSSLVAECILEGRTASATLLLSHGASLDSQDDRGQSLLEIATRNGIVWLVKHLIELGAPFDAVANREQGNNLLHIVAEAGQPELIEILADRGANLTATNDFGENPIHIAVGSGSSDLIGPFFERGVSLEQPDQSGARPLHLAVMRRDGDSLAELLRLGARANATGPLGKTALEFALEAREYSFASQLIIYGAKVPGTLLYEAIEKGDRDQIDFLISNGVDPNTLGQLSDDTPLGAAIRRGNRWAAFRLLDSGAYPNAVTRDGQTAFHLAVAQLDRTLIAQMLEKGADPNIPFSDYPNQDFLQHVASPNIAKSSLRHTRRFTPIAMAADSGDLEIARLLLSHGANPAIFCRGGRYHYWYPISWAARRSDIAMMQILLGREPSQVTRSAKIDLSEQRAWVYDGDEEIFTTRVSTGKAGSRTKTGEFVITNRERHWNSTIYGSSMPYFQRFSCSDFGFHEGYVPGYAASHGCIRVPGGNVKKLWDLLSLGDPVVIVP